MQRHNIILVLNITLILFLATLLFYFPILINPSLILERGNDLQEQFWPVFYFIREQFWQTHTLPLWNNLIFSGTPLLPDPQFSLSYPPNWLFIILPTDIAFIVWLILHTFLSGVFFWLLSRHVFRFSFLTSFILAFLYLTSPKLGGYLESGHYGLVGTLTWLPLVVLSCFKLVTAKRLEWSALLGISYASIFYLHTVTLFLVVIASVLLILTLAILAKASFVKTFLGLTLSVVISVGLTAITLLPQLEWLPQTTRFLLLQDRDVYPKWTSVREFVSSSMSPFLSINPSSLDTEKWLFLGIVPVILALVGFLKLNSKYKILIAISLLVVALIASNNASPIYNLLLTQDWFVLQRVATRIWFVTMIMVLILAGCALEKLYKRKLLFFLLVVLACLESVYISWLAINKPVDMNEDRFVSREVYEFLASDKEYEIFKNKFRVFCTTRCLSQKEAAIYNLELIEGYNTLQQKNYYDQFIQLSQVFWDRYTLALPPLEIYNFREIQPYSPDIAGYNVKYVIAPYSLKDKNLVLKKEIGKYLIYENTIVKSRAYFGNGHQAPIMEYSPNYIKVNTSAHETNQLIVAEVFNTGWTAKLPKEVLIASASSPFGSLSLFGDIICQNIEWFTCPPPLFLTVILISSGILFKSNKSSSAVFSANSGCFSMASFKFLT